MAGEQTESVAQGESNGVATHAPPVERASMTRAQQDAADRAAFMAGDETAEEVAPVKAKVVKRPVEVEDDAESDTEVEALEDAVEEEEDDLELDDDEDEEAVEDEEEAEPTKAKTDDPELAKRLAQVRKHEKRVREQSDARDRAFERERESFVSEWKPKIEEYQKFEQLKSKRSDVVGVLKSLGYTDEDFDWIAPVVHGLSKTGAADPKYRDYAKRLMSEREMKEESAAARREAAEVKEMLASRDAQADADRKIDAYRERILKSTSDTPKLKKQLEMAPKATRTALDRHALKLAEKSGGLVDPKIVARSYEKKLTAIVERAKRLAGDDAEVETAAPAIKAKAKSTAIKVVDKTKTAAPAQKNGSLIPSREEMIDRMRKIDRGELDPDAD